MAEERLQKILSRAGIASRRAAEALILEGRVQVNGEVVQELGAKADPAKDVIRVDKAVIAEPEELTYFVLYKPERVVTTLEDPEGRTSVGDLIQRAKLKVYPVGRLDYDAEGALLLTNDGALAHKLTHPRWGVPRTYLAKVKGEPGEDTLAKMREGLRLEDGMARAQEATFERRTPRNTWIRLVVTEGRHHLIKRLCEAAGHPVVRLFRSDYGGVGVRGMHPGDIRPLSSTELQVLRQAVAQEAPLPPGGRPRKKALRRSSAVRDPIYGDLRRGPAHGTGEGAGTRPLRGPRGPRGPLGLGRSAPVADTRSGPGEAAGASGRGRQGGLRAPSRAPRGGGAPTTRPPARAARGDASSAARTSPRAPRGAPAGAHPPSRAPRGGAGASSRPASRPPRGGSTSRSGRPATPRQGPRTTGKGPKGRR